VVLVIGVVGFELFGLTLAVATIGLEWTLIVAMGFAAALVFLYWWLGWSLLH